jgi:hypothetical protein
LRRDDLNSLTGNGSYFLSGGPVDRQRAGRRRTDHPSRRVEPCWMTGAVGRRGDGRSVKFASATPAAPAARCACLLPGGIHPVLPEALVLGKVAAVPGDPPTGKTAQQLVSRCSAVALIVHQRHRRRIHIRLHPCLSADEMIYASGHRADACRHMGGRTPHQVPLGWRFLR